MSKTWSDVVHEQRKSAAVAQARSEHRQRRRGYAVQVQPNAKVPVLLAVAGVLSGLAAWRREGEHLRSGDWRALPVVRQLLSLVNSQPRPSGAPRGKVKPRATTMPSTGRSGSGANAAAAASAAAAAGAAAINRAASAQQRQQQPQQQLQLQQQQPQQQQQGGGGGGGGAQKKPSKKKGGGKKRR